MKNIKKFNKFVNENKGENKSEYDKMVAEIDSEITVNDWLDEDEAQEYQAQNTEIQDVDPDDVGDNYVVEIGAETQKSWLSKSKIGSAINFLKRFKK